MAVWFIRLGARNQPESRKLYESFAKNHSLIKIGYGIDDDITDKKNREEIKEYLEAKGESGQAANIRAGLIHRFINEMEIGDVIICPFGKAPEKVRIGIVASECNIVESFFEPTFKVFFRGRKKKLEKIVDEYEYSDGQGAIEIKPARRVKWLTGEMDKNEFFDQLREQLKKYMPSTVNELKIENEKVVNFLDFIDPDSKKPRPNKIITISINKSLSGVIKLKGNSKRLLKSLKIAQVFAKFQVSFIATNKFLGGGANIIAMLSLILAILSITMCGNW